MDLHTNFDCYFLDFRLEVVNTESKIEQVEEDFEAHTFDSRDCIQPFGSVFIHFLEASFQFFGVHFKRTYDMVMAFNWSKKHSCAILSASLAEVYYLKLVRFLANSGCIFIILD